MSRWALLVVVAAGCYGGARASRDVNQAWRGRSRATIEARWGRPAAERPGGETALLWSHTQHHFELPSGSASVDLGPGHADVSAELRPGAIWDTTTEATATVDGAGTITHVEGASVRWGPPNDVNLHWGTILGLHAGMGRLDNTSTPRPAGGMYVGGMLSRTLGLVGFTSVAFGKGNGGGAMGLAGGVAAQWWLATRLWLRAGPALVLAFDPGFTHTSLGPGLATGASFAFLKVGTLALDLRIDFTAARDALFGNLGVGVNLN